MTDLERALEDCLARLAEDPYQGTSGEARLEECLARYPEQAGELRRLLGVVRQLERGRAVSAPADFKVRARARLMAHMTAHPRSTPGSASFPPVKFQLVLGLAALVVVFLVAGTALAQAALPGSAGYGWKIASERVWRVFQPDPLAADVMLANRRAEELVRVADDPHAQVIALQEYQQALETLGGYTLPAAQPIIHQALVEQKQSLDQAGLEVPELNELLTPVPSGLAPPESTLAPPPRPTLVLSPESPLVPSPEPTLALSTPTLPSALPTLSSIEETPLGGPALSLPLPTLDPLLP